MDPSSLSISTDQQQQHHHHHQHLHPASAPPPPPQFAPFPPFAAAAPNPFPVPFAVSAASNNNNHHHVFAPAPAPPPQVPPTQHQHQQQQPLPPHPSFNHPPYADMICAAIAALNEPEGSSKQAISRYIERVYAGLPPAHAALLTHHLKSLKNSGILVMVKKSYKFASSAPPPVSTLDASRSDPPGFDQPLHNQQQLQLQQPLGGVAGSDLTGAATSLVKRGRGRPPKPKPEALLGNPEPFIQSNGQQQPGSDLNVLPLPVSVSVSGSIDETQLTKRRPGRPRKNGVGPQGSVVAAVKASPVKVMKRRGRPPARRGVGRPRKPKSVSAPSMVFGVVAANGPRRRGRPKRADSGAAPVTPSVGEGGVVLPGKRRGRPPKIGGVISKPMKPKRSTGRPVGRPRKNASWATIDVAEPQASAAYGELKRKLEFFQEKVKQAVGVLRAEVTSENQDAISAIEELEGLAAMDISMPQAEEAQTQEEQPEEQEQQQQQEAMQEMQPQAEAMQEAQLF